MNGHWISIRFGVVDWLTETLQATYFRLAARTILAPTFSAVATQVRGVTFSAITIREATTLRALTVQTITGAATFLGAAVAIVTVTTQEETSLVGVATQEITTFSAVATVGATSLAIATQGAATFLVAIAPVTFSGTMGRVTIMFSTTTIQEATSSPTHATVTAFSITETASSTIPKTMA